MYSCNGEVYGNMLLPVRPKLKFSKPPQVSNIPEEGTHLENRG